MEAFTFNTVELILLSAAGILFIIQLIYYFGLYNRIHVHNKAVGKEEVHFIRELPPLSVILCARNEAENLRKILPAILEQDYPQFEVIVINDASTDDTEDILGVMEEKYPHLYHSFTPESARYISHKKLALTLGIKASKHDWLVFTETNCTTAQKDGCTNVLHSILCSSLCAIWDSRWPENLISVSDATWLTGKNYSFNRKVSPNT